jgi:hypothetical protein
MQSRNAVAADAISRYGLTGGIVVAVVAVAALVGFHFRRRRLAESP